ncbi:MAG: hypothetical protein GOU98_04510 [Candidatus Altiarchaeota archaeon]|nr:hypothetical protein [Candidatus Altiarchaeota archaeon]
MDIEPTMRHFEALEDALFKYTHLMLAGSGKNSDFGKWASKAIPGVSKQTDANYYFSFPKSTFEFSFNVGIDDRGFPQQLTQYKNGDKRYYIAYGDLVTKRRKGHEDIVHKPSVFLFQNPESKKLIDSGDDDSPLLFGDSVYFAYESSRGEGDKTIPTLKVDKLLKSDQGESVYRHVSELDILPIFDYRQTIRDESLSHNKTHSIIEPYHQTKGGRVIGDYFVDGDAQLILQDETLGGFAQNEICVLTKGRIEVLIKHLLLGGDFMGYQLPSEQTQPQVIETMYETSKNDVNVETLDKYFDGLN